MPLTPDSDLDLLFPEELVPQHIKVELPPELHVRPLIPISQPSPLLFSSLPLLSPPPFPFPMSSPYVYLTHPGCFFSST